MHNSETERGIPGEEAGERSVYPQFWAGKMVIQMLLGGKPCI